MVNVIAVGQQRRMTMEIQTEKVENNPPGPDDDGDDDEDTD